MKKWLIVFLCLIILVLFIVTLPSFNNNSFSNTNLISEGKIVVAKKGYFYADHYGDIFYFDEDSVTKILEGYDSKYLHFENKLLYFFSAESNAFYSYDFDLDKLEKKLSFEETPSFCILYKNKLYYDTSKAIISYNIRDTTQSVHFDNWVGPKASQYSLHRSNLYCTYGSKLILKLSLKEKNMLTNLNIGTTYYPILYKDSIIVYSSHNKGFEIQEYSERENELSISSIPKEYMVLGSYGDKLYLKNSYKNGPAGVYVLDGQGEAKFISDIYTSPGEAVPARFMFTDKYLFYQSDRLDRQAIQLCDLSKLSGSLIRYQYALHNDGSLYLLSASQNRGIYS